jgi:hypothetical protein
LKESIKIYFFLQRTCNKELLWVKHTEAQVVYPSAEDFNDNTTMARYSIMFHYTPELRDAYQGDTVLIWRRLQSGRQHESNLYHAVAE